MQVPLVVGNVLERFVGSLERGVVDQHVDSLERVCGLCDHLSAVGRIGDVSRHGDGLLPGGFDEPGGVCCIVTLLEV